MKGVKMLKKKVKKAKKVKAEKAEKSAKAKKPAAQAVGGEITVKLPSGEVTGICTSKRKTNSGAQVFVRIPGQVSRWVNAEDVVK